MTPPVKVGDAESGSRLCLWRGSVDGEPFAVRLPSSADPGDVLRYARESRQIDAVRRKQKALARDLAEIARDGEEARHEAALAAIKAEYQREHARIDREADESQMDIYRQLFPPAPYVED